MEDILAHSRELASRNTFRKLLYKAEDAEAIKTLNEHLTHAYHLFMVRLRGLLYDICLSLPLQIQSFVGIRIWQLRQPSPQQVAL